MTVLFVKDVKECSPAPGPWERVSGFRDLGCLRGAEGLLRPGRIFRSGAFSQATEADCERLHLLGVRTVVDLRHQDQVSEMGADRLPTGVRQVSLPLAFGDLCGGDRSFASLLECNRARIVCFFALLAQEESYPLVFHCQHGKKRTGAMAALLLELLGARRRLIVEDFQAAAGEWGRCNSAWLQEIWSLVDAAGGIEAFLAAIGVEAHILNGVRRQLQLPPEPAALGEMATLIHKKHGFGIEIVINSNDHAPAHMHVNNPSTGKLVAKVHIPTSAPKKADDIIPCDGYVLTTSQKNAILKALLYIVPDLNAPIWKLARYTWNMFHPYDEL